MNTLSTCTSTMEHKDHSLGRRRQLLPLTERFLFFFFTFLVTCAFNSYTATFFFIAWLSEWHVKVGVHMCPVAFFFFLSRIVFLFLSFFKVLFSSLFAQCV